MLECYAIASQRAELLDDLADCREELETMVTLTPDETRAIASDLRELQAFRDAMGEV